MKKLLLPLAMVVVLVLVGIRLYEEVGSSSSPPSRPGGPPQRTAMLVETATAAPHEFLSTLEALGELIPLASVEVMSRISGRLKEVDVDLGDPVQENQLLAVVEVEGLSQQIVRAEASISVARASVRREEASYDNLELQARRFKQLHSDSLVSTQDLEDVESRLQVAQAQLELARAQVEQAIASLRELKTLEAETQIFCPMNGFVGSRNLDRGALVNPSLSIVSVIDLSRVKTVVPVPEALLSLMRIGLPAKIRMDAYPGKLYRGTITRISPFLDPGTRTVDVEIEMPNEGTQLKPGMFARVSIESSKPESSLAIPRAALLTRADEKGVLLLDEDLVTHYRKINIGRIQDDFVEVLEGLSEGTVVVTTGAQKLNDGDKVKIG